MCAGNIFYMPPQADERVLFSFHELRLKHNISTPLETPVGQVWSEKDW